MSYSLYLYIPDFDSLVGWCSNQTSGYLAAQGQSYYNLQACREKQNGFSFTHVRKYKMLQEMLLKPLL